MLITIFPAIIRKTWPTPIAPEFGFLSSGTSRDARNASKIGNIKLPVHICLMELATPSYNGSDPQKHRTIDPVSSTFNYVVFYWLFLFYSHVLLQ